MRKRKYQLPAFLDGRCSQEAYQRWLGRKATAHHRRDRKRGNTEATRAAYMVAIHEAVLSGGGFDEYTGQPLKWELISTYRNVDSKAGRRTYKKIFADLPTVDHVGDGLGLADFRICAWRTNDSKSDLSYDEFVALCEQVVRHRDRTSQAAWEPKRPHS